MRSSDESTSGPREHGGLEAGELARLGLDPAGIVDFSVNVNFYGPCPAVLEAVRKAPIDRYPDPTALPARREIAASLDLAPERIVLGNGASELLWTIAHAFLEPGAKALIVEPTFSEFRAAVSAARGRVLEWRAREENGFALDLGAIESQVAREQPSLIYICNPNNPTGVATKTEALASLADAFPGTILVLDQAFLSLSEVSHEASLALPENVIAVRSITKEHAIPGVRVGYLVADPLFAVRIESLRPAWSTSSVAQAAARAAVCEERFVTESRSKLLRDRDALVRTLREIGLSPLPSTTTFVIVRVGNARELRRKLLEAHGILVRDCSSFGLPDHVRLGARPERDVARLVGALR